MPGRSNGLVASVAGGLAGLGVRRRDVVAWQLPNWWEVLVLFRACWRLGAVAAPIHHQVGAAEVGAMVSDLGPRVSLAAAGMPLADLVDAIGVRTGDGRFDQLIAAPAARLLGSVADGGPMSPWCCSPRARPGGPKRCSTAIGAWPTRPGR